MIIITQPALAEWTEASSDIRGNKYFVDMESIRISGNYRKYWGLINFSSPQNQSVEQLKRRSSIKTRRKWQMDKGSALIYRRQNS